MQIKSTKKKIFKNPRTRNKNNNMYIFSESEKTKWVVALNELHRILKKNKLPDR